jgi:hypothetical protein
MLRRTFLGNMIATAVAAVAGLPWPTLTATAIAEAPEIDPEDMLRCEACGGVGWVNGGGYRYPDCKHCDGSGVMTTDQVNAYWDRNIG